MLSKEERELLEKGFKKREIPYVTFDSVWEVFLQDIDNFLDAHNELAVVCNKIESDIERIWDSELDINTFMVEYLNNNFDYDKARKRIEQYNEFVEQAQVRSVDYEEFAVGVRDTLRFLQGKVDECNESDEVKDFVIKKLIRLMEEI